MRILPNITMVVDLQYGSTGKGAIAAYLSKHGNFDTVISANRVNAGHTGIDDNGVKYIHKALPSGIFNKSIKRVMIGPGAVFSPDRLESEVKFALANGWLKDAVILVHDMAVPVTPAMKTAEENSPVVGIASTAQGTLFADIAKLQRDPKAAVVVRDAYTPAPDLPITTISNLTWLSIIHYQSKNILAEGAQGYSLGINQDFYPYCTSRDCGPARFLSDMALPVKAPLTIVGSMRTYPIRVGNTDKGSSGGCYPDQSELQWSDVGVEPETTTVTGRIRRVFSISLQQFEDAITETCCDEVFLNFLNYLSIQQRTELIDVLGEIAGRHGTKLRYLGFGPTMADITEVGHGH